MNGAFKLIKIFALFLAGMIMVGMLIAIISLGSLIAFVTGVDSGTLKDEVGVIWEGEKDMQKITKLVVDTGAANLRIVSTQDDGVTVETNIEQIESWQEAGVLRVKEKSRFAIFGLEDTRGEVVIKLPEKWNLDEVNVDMGAGTLEISDITANKVKLELGAGRTTIDRLRVRDQAKINGGVGTTEIRSSELNDLKLELGAGKTEVEAKITGDSKIESGVGRLELNLLEDMSAYRIRVDKGIGSFTIDGRDVRDNATYGDGRNDIKIDAGVGSIEVRTAGK